MASVSDLGSRTADRSEQFDRSAAGSTGKEAGPERGGRTRRGRKGRGDKDKSHTVDPSQASTTSSSSDRPSMREFDGHVHEAHADQRAGGEFHQPSAARGERGGRRGRHHQSDTADGSHSNGDRAPRSGRGRHRGQGQRSRTDGRPAAYHTNHGTSRDDGRSWRAESEGASTSTRETRTSDAAACLNADAASFVPLQTAGDVHSRTSRGNGYTGSRGMGSQSSAVAGATDPGYDPMSQRHVMAAESGRGAARGGRRQRATRGKHAVATDDRPSGHWRNGQGHEHQAGRNAAAAAAAAANSDPMEAGGEGVPVPGKHDREELHEPASASQATATAAASADASQRRCSQPPKKTLVKKATGSARADEIIDELESNSCECMVCCDVIQHSHRVWTCHQCFRIFHLNCIQKWGRSESARVQPSASAAEASLDPLSGWRCPSCREVHKHIPTSYWCFCGKADLGTSQQRSRRREYGKTPHSCGDICGKHREQAHCNHRCNQLCHPGPCPPCPAMLQLSCGCGRSKQTVRCSQAGQAPSCQSVCDRALLCGRHRCTGRCHDGPCAECEHELEQTCNCGRTKRVHPCAGAPTDAGAATPDNGSFCCEELCHRPLACGNHLCESACHPGPCKTCVLSPAVIKTCHCGQVKLEDLASSGVAEARRDSCMDPVPSCAQTCNKALPCGPVEEGNPHRCHVTCHEGPCRPCPSRSVRTCRCGQSTQKLPCKEVVVAGKEILCERVCNAKRSCGRHRCSQRCCVDERHECLLVCGKKLRCNRHKCEELCHKGHCEQCWQSIYTELTCHCGGEVLLPPQPCGTRPPACRRACSRVHACEHPPQHGCHTEDRCPKCPILVDKMCMGGHLLRTCVACAVVDVSCGERCDKALACGKHACDRQCHRGVCLDDGKACAQPCSMPRLGCLHSCAAPCHGDRRCPETPCRTAIVLHCQCGRRSLEVTCAQATGKANGLVSGVSSADLARRMASARVGGSVSFDHKVEVTCDTECAHQERVRQLAEALRVDGAMPPNCSLSQFLMDKIKSESSTVLSIDSDISALVKGVLRMPPGSHKVLSLPTMSSDHRHVVHEVAELYGCESQSIDSEPNRSVRVTAFSHSYPPRTSLSDLVMRFRASALPAQTGSLTTPRSAPTPAPAQGWARPEGNPRKPAIDHFADP